MRATPAEFTRTLPRRYVTRPRRQTTNRPLLIGVVAAMALMLVMLLPTVAMAYVYQNRIYPGVHVLGKDIGGLTHAEARLVLQSVQAGELNRPITLKTKEQEWTATASELGITLDLERTIEEARLLGRQRDPLSNLITQGWALAFGWNVKPAFTIDDRQRAAVLAYLQAVIDRPVQDARLSLDADNRMVVLPSQIGRQLDTKHLNEQIERAASGQRDGAIALKVNETAPFVTEKDLEALRASAERILSTPVRLVYGRESWTLGRKELAEMLTLPAARRSTGEQLTINPQLLTEYVQRLATQINRPPRDAKFGFARGEVTVVQESQDGLEVDVAQTVRAILDAVAGDGRDVPLAVRVEPPKVPTSEKDRMAITDRLFRATSDYGGGIPERLHNVELATRRLDGILIAPGETFSFNQALGPATIENGFKWGFGIASTGQNGGFQTVPSEAGGICQVATTLFQAVFRSGLEIVERSPHLYWIPRYAGGTGGMVGLDATVDDPNVDFKFKNNTGNWVAISSTVDKARNVIAFEVWGVDPRWKVEIPEPKITDWVKADPTIIYQESDFLPYGEMWVESATDGFTVEITRTVKDASGKIILGPSVFRTKYEPSRNVKLVRKGNAPAAGAAPPPASGSTSPSTRPSTSGSSGATAPSAVPSPSAAPAPSRPTSPAPSTGPAAPGTAPGSGTSPAAGSQGSSGTGGTNGTTSPAAPANPAPAPRPVQPPAVNPAPAAPVNPPPAQPAAPRPAAPANPAPANPAPSLPVAPAPGTSGGSSAMPPPIAPSNPAARPGQQGPNGPNR